jgi:hypothetical protein
MVRPATSKSRRTGADGLVRCNRRRVDWRSRWASVNTVSPCRVHECYVAKIGHDVVAVGGDRGGQSRPEDPGGFQVDIPGDMDDRFIVVHRCLESADNAAEHHTGC